MCLLLVSAKYCARMDYFQQSRQRTRQKKPRVVCQCCHILSAYQYFTCIIDCSTLHILVCSSHNRPKKNIMHYELWHKAFSYEPSGGQANIQKNESLELKASTCCVQSACDNLRTAVHKGRVEPQEAGAEFMFMNVPAFNFLWPKPNQKVINNFQKSKEIVV